MENIPQVIVLKLNEMRQPIIISIKPYMYDHSFLGNAVLPAVEAMRIIADWASEKYPGMDVSVINDARFLKFMRLVPGDESINAAIDYDEFEEYVAAALITINKLKSGITRIKEHVTVKLPKACHIEKAATIPEVPNLVNNYRVGNEKIYSELVPFGTAYQNARWVEIAREGACVVITSPVIEEYDDTLPLGNPFLLDAAFHAACVWGQRHCGIVGFPVAFSKRIVLSETRAGEEYSAYVIPSKESCPELLVFDIFLYSGDDSLAEIVYGLEMRDVSSGRLRPPFWILAQ